MEIAGVQAAAGAGDGADAAWKAKLSDGARQFEAMLLEQMMKPLAFGAAPGAAGADDADQDEATDAGADVVRGFGTEALARAVVAGGGFGIARQILRQVTAEHEAQAAHGTAAKVG